MSKAEERLWGTQTHRKSRWFQHNSFNHNVLCKEEAYEKSVSGFRADSANFALFSFFYLQPAVDQLEKGDG